jgi:hypothetical protein
MRAKWRMECTLSAVVRGQSRISFRPFSNRNQSPFAVASATFAYIAAPEDALE